MHVIPVIVGTAILVLVPVVWGIGMAYVTEFVKRLARRGAKRD